MWQTAYGTCLEKSPSGYAVYQNLFYRWLTLNSSALQTVIYKHNPHKPILHYLPPFTLMARHYPGSNCLLGLGGSGAAHYLQATSITAVEFSQEVIDLAQRWFMLDAIKGLSLVHQNAADFVQTSNQRFNHLMIDLFTAHHFPNECNTENFFFHCVNRLEENGLLSLNLANYEEQWPIFQYVKKYFTNTLVIPVKKSANIIILASNNESPMHFLERIKATGAIKSLRIIPPWGLVVR